MTQLTPGHKQVQRSAVGRDTMLAVLIFWHFQVNPHPLTAVVGWKMYPSFSILFILEMKDRQRHSKTCLHNILLTDNTKYYRSYISSNNYKISKIALKSVKYLKFRLLNTTISYYSYQTKFGCNTECFELIMDKTICKRKIVLFLSKMQSCFRGTFSKDFLLWQQCANKRRDKKQASSITCRF